MKSAETLELDSLRSKAIVNGGLKLFEPRLKKCGKAMVYLVLRRTGLSEAIRAARQTGSAIWIGSDVTTAEENSRLQSEGVNLTIFTYPLSDAAREDLEDALSTIVEHHPNDVSGSNMYVPANASEAPDRCHVNEGLCLVEDRVHRSCPA